MDEDTFKDDKLGVLNLTMAELCDKFGFQEKTFDLVEGKKNLGKLYLKTKYVPAVDPNEVDDSNNWDATGKFEMVKQ